MPNYNIFRVDPELRADMLVKFQDVGLTETYNEELDGYQHVFFFSDKPIDAQIEWIQLYSSFISLADIPSNESYFAVLLIRVPSGNEYAISLGKAHFYLKAYCVYDFGLQLAERIFKKSKMKQAKHFSSRRSKTITSYSRSNELSYESGESIGLIKGSTTDAETWGKSVTFGQSVKLSTNHLPDELYLMLDEIENAMQSPQRLHLPRAQVVKDEADIRRLDEILCKKLQSNDVSIDIDEFTVNSVFFTFTDEYDGFGLQIKAKLGEVDFSEKAPKEDSISREAVGKFLSSINEKGIHSIDYIDKVKVALWKDGKRRYTQPLKELIEFVTDDWYCLISGKWMKFSQDYVKYLKDQVDNVQLKRDEPITLTKYTKTQREAGSKNEEEQTLIDRVATEKGYNILHKSHSDEAGIDGFNVEIADMRSTECLYFVKMGTAQKLIYVINQSLTTVSLVQNKRIDGDPSVQGINTICLWLIFDDRKSDISTLSEISSITFLIAMSDWIQSVRDAGYIPAVNISYRRLFQPLCDWSPATFRQQKIR